MWVCYSIPSCPFPTSNAFFKMSPKLSCKNYTLDKYFWNSTTQSICTISINSNTGLPKFLFICLFFPSLLTTQSPVFLLSTNFWIWQCVFDLDWYIDFTEVFTFQTDLLCKHNHLLVHYSWYIHSVWMSILYFDITFPANNCRETS